MSADDKTYRPLGAAHRPAPTPEPEQPEPAFVRLPPARDRLALVTGGHRRLGAVIAAALAEAGYALAIHGSHDTQLDPTLESAIGRNGTTWEGFVADFSDPETAEELIADIAGRFGRPPDLLVNSAAIFGQDRLMNVSADDLQRHYQVNCAAPVLLTKAFATVPSGSGDRCIVNILDQRIDHPHGDQLAYTLSKLALAGFTKIAARELAPHIRVNAVAPGLTMETADYSPAQMEKLKRMMPLHALSEPQHVAEAVLYLTRAATVTGQTLYVDGGAHLKAYDRDFMHL